MLLSSYAFLLAAQTATDESPESVANRTRAAIWVEAAKMCTGKARKSVRRELETWVHGVEGEGVPPLGTDWRERAEEARAEIFLESAVRRWREASASR